jgi:hypothetical protein
MPGNGQIWGIHVSEDLNPETGEISPDRGNSCNKSNRTGVNAPGYSAACSLSAPLPGLYVAVLQERSSAPASLAAAPCRHSAAGLRGQAGPPFVLSSGTSVQYAVLLGASSPIPADSRVQSRLSWRVTRRHFPLMPKRVFSTRASLGIARHTHSRLVTLLEIVATFPSS